LDRLWDAKRNFFLEKFHRKRFSWADQRAITASGSDATHPDSRQRIVIPI
jgi:hypothetical protein